MYSNIRYIINSQNVHLWFCMKISKYNLREIDSFLNFLPIGFEIDVMFRMIYHQENCITMTKIEREKDYKCNY